VRRNVRQTCRFFGVSRGLFYICKKRYEKDGLAGFWDQPRRPNRIRYRIPPEIISLIHRIREECRYGAPRTSLYLQRHYRAYVSPTTILKISHRHHIGRISLKKYRPVPNQRTHPSRFRAVLSNSMGSSFHVREEPANPSINSQLLTRPLAFVFCEFTTTTTQRPQLTSSRRSVSIFPLPFKESRRITTPRSDLSSPGIFPISAFLTAAPLPDVLR